LVYKSLQGSVGVAYRGVQKIACAPEGGGAWGVKTLRDDGGARIIIIWRRELLGLRGLLIYMYWTPTWRL
jgi:hypothetical protein